MSIGKRIKELREKRGISQNRLAQMTGIRQASISRIEAGIAENIRTDNAMNIARVLGVSTDLLLGNGKPAPSDYVGHDKDVDRLVMTYADLDAEGREDLLNYARFLKGNEK